VKEWSSFDERLADLRSTSRTGEGEVVEIKLSTIVYTINTAFDNKK